MLGETHKPIFPHPRPARQSTSGVGGSAHTGRVRNSKFPSVAAAVCCLALALLAPGGAFAQLLTGQILNYPESDPFYTYSFGDGTHTVHLTWSVNHVNRSGYFYRNYYTDVALATGVSSIGQITNAAAFTFTTQLNYYVGPVNDVGYTGGRDSFIILKDTTSDFYGVVRVDDVFAYATPIDHGIYGKSHAGLNATWWFQPNGSANFAPVVPEPSIAALLIPCLVAALLRRRV